MHSSLTAVVVALGATVFTSYASAQSAAPAISHQQAIDLAAANKIAMPMESWSNPKVGLMGVEGFGTDGEWYEVVIDTTGKIVRAGSNDSKEPAVKMKAAAESALKNGIAKLEGLWLSGGNWVARGWDSAEKSTVLMIDGATGEAKKLGS